MAFILNFIIETLARQSIFNGFAFLTHHPLVFFYNVLIIFVTLSIVIFFKRRVFVYIIVSGLWLTLGVINGLILANRMTPFTTKDIAILEDGITIVTNYLSTTEIILAGVGILLLIGLLAVTFIFAPKRKEKINYKRSALIFLIIIALMGGSTGIALKTKTVDTYFPNLAYAYRDFGVPYCFINTWLNTGIGKPIGYSQDKILSIFDEKELGSDGYMELSDKDDGKKHPNVIFLQLESFVDPDMMKNITLSGDATPYWKELKKKYSTGYLNVPVVGAGTANTEFEVMCGMSVKFFGPGEYPYKAVLKEQTCESYAYDLKNIGYSTHAIHNHRGVFYGRNIVFSNLGYDSFTCLEYMSNVVKTPKNWSKDNVLVSNIMDALEYTDNEDYIYTISVQGHGKYPTEQVIEDPEITVTSAPTEELKWQYEYYVNQAHEMDKFVKNLTEQLEAYDEDVVLVMYGDHLPALDLTEQDMESGDLYKTDYIIWNNFNMKKQDKELHTYQLTAEVLDRIGIHEGTMTKFHQNHSDDENYMSELRSLEYDMIYGKHYIYGGENPFSPTKLKMGIKDIKIEEIVQIGEKFYIKGENFTEYSKISLDGEVLKTIYLGPTVLGLLDDVNPEDVSRMKVSQVDRNSGSEILSTTE